MKMNDLGDAQRERRKITLHNLYSFSLRVVLEMLVDDRTSCKNENMNTFVFNSFNIASTTQRA